MRSRREGLLEEVCFIDVKNPARMEDRVDGEREREREVRSLGQVPRF